jgi:rhodanese-related sulfurtransferase
MNSSIFRHLKDLWIVVSFSMIFGFINNVVSPHGISLIYSANNNPFFQNQTVSGNQEFPRIIGLDEAKSFFDSKTAKFVDARPFQTYFDAHIPGAISFPLEEFDKVYKEVEPQLPKSFPIIIYCDNIRCDLSSRLAFRLIQKGYLNIYIFENGIKHWQTTAYPMDKN